MALAAGPFKISYDSTSFGFQSTARFDTTVPSVCPKPPKPVPPSSSRLKFDVEKAELSIGTPSITSNGWFGPRIELTPRMLMNEPAPGSEERRVGKECRSRWSPQHCEEEGSC